MRAGTRLTYPGGMEGLVDLVDLTAPRPGVEPETSQSRVRRRTSAAPRQPVKMQPVTASVPIRFGVDGVFRPYFHYGCALRCVAGDSQR